MKLLKDSFFKEPDVVITMKCLWCGETLLFGSEECRYCGAPVGNGHAFRSAVISTILNRAITLANTIETGRLAMLVLIPSALFSYALDLKIMFIGCVLLPTAGACTAVIRWGYKYGDIEAGEPEFVEAKRKMRRHLRWWLACVAAELFTLMVW